MFSKIFKAKEIPRSEPCYIEVSGLQIEVVRKAVKHLRLMVSPPTGRVRVAAPAWVSDDTVRRAVVERLGWIYKQQARIAAQPMLPQHEILSGEEHYFQGRLYRLQVVEQSNRPSYVEPGDNLLLTMYLRNNTSVAQRVTVLNNWYREHLKQEIPLLINKWQSIMGVHVEDWGIKQMKTRWGSCNIRARRIWLNLELAKHSASCLEYVVVHEMVHLFERHHNERFKKLMDQFLPQWRLLKAELNRSMLGRENQPC